MKKDKDTRIIRRFDPDSNEEFQKEEDLHDMLDPFTVKYGFDPMRSSKKGSYDLPIQYIPADLSVKLYSKHLQAVTRKLLPDKLQLYGNYGEIQANYLLLFI